MAELRPPLGWGFAGLKDKARRDLAALEAAIGAIDPGLLEQGSQTLGRLDLVEQALETLNETTVPALQSADSVLDGRLDAIEVWASRIKGLSASAPTPGPNTQVGDIYLAQTPTAGGNIGWVCVMSGENKVFKAFGAIANGE